MTPPRPEPFHYAGTPRGIDFTSDGKANVERCVYHIEGDNLTLVFPTLREQRPTSTDRGDVKVVFRRKR
jgi:hypothetical protein